MSLKKHAVPWRRRWSLKGIATLSALAVVALSLPMATSAYAAEGDVADPAVVSDVVLPQDDSSAPADNPVAPEVAPTTEETDITPIPDPVPATEPDLVLASEPAPEPDPAPALEQATEPIITMPPVQYMTILWKVMDTDNNGDDWEQSLVGNVVTSTPSLNALDELMTQTECTRYQADVYLYTLASDKEKVDALIARGILNGPSNPVEEPLIAGGAGTAWKVVGTNGICEPEPVVTMSGQCELVGGTPTYTYEISESAIVDATYEIFDDTKAGERGLLPGGESLFWTTLDPEIVVTINDGPPQTVVATTCVPDVVQCEQVVDGGTVTNLYMQGWVVTNGEWVADGLLLTSDNWIDATVSKSTSFNLSAARSLALDMDVSGVGNVGLGIVLHTSAGDLHWEDIYTDEFWSNEAVLPPTGGGQGGPFSGSLEDALETIGDVEVTSVTIVFSAATQNGAFLQSATFNCTVVVFEYEEIVVVPVLPGTEPQKCMATDNGQSFTGGSVTFADTPSIAYSIEGGETTGLAPDDYVVTATVDPEVDWTALGEAEGWTLHENGTATTTVTIEAAEDCAVQPPNKKIETTWDGAWKCNDTQVTQTRKVWTIPYILVDNTWVLDEEHATTPVTETRSRDLTAAERTTCPVPPTPTPPTLASTGFNLVDFGLGALLLTLFGWAFVAFGRRRRWMVG